jgi:hypothetical protein
MRVNLIAFLMLFSSVLSAQYRDKVWMLGGYGINNSGINFNNGMADTFSVIRDLEFFLTNASICDTAGNLLFYTNGQLLYNRFHQPMLNSSNFNPGAATLNNYPYGLNINQAVLILPKPQTDSRYNLFHFSSEHFNAHSIIEDQPLEFFQSVIDMGLDNGRGAITGIKNQVILNDTLSHGAIVGCKHANGRDWWIVLHRYWNNQFYKFLLTPDTIFQSTQFEGSNVRYDVFLEASFTRDGTRYVYMSQYPQIDLFEFDRCSGALTLKEALPSPDTSLGNLGCAFSPNGEFLYVCNNLNIYQYDVTAANVNQSRILVAQWDGSNVQGFNTTFFMMQLAPDNRIYVSTAQGTNVLHVINSPDSAGMACNVVQQGLVLPWYNAFSMPNHTNYEVGPIDGSLCDSLGLNNVAVINQSQQANSVTVFPNPSASWFNFLIQNETVSSVTVYNLFGEVTVTSTKPNINLSGEPSGVYLYRVKTRSGKEFRGKLQKL